MRRLAVVGMLVAGLIVGAACSGADDEPLGPTGSLQQGTTTTLDPYAVPSVIDEAYVNRVLAGLDHAVGDVTRLVVETRTIPPEAVDRLKAIYLDSDLLQLVVDSYQEELFRELEGIRPNPGDNMTTVVELLTVKSRCVFAKVRTDASKVALFPGAVVEQWVALRHVDETFKAEGFNGTNWGFIYEGFAPGFTAPEDPCVEF